MSNILILLKSAFVKGAAIGIAGRLSLFSAAILTGVAFNTPFASADVDEALEVECAVDDLCRIKISRLPLRVLPRVDSLIYETAEEGAETAAAVQPFSPLFVFEKIGVNYDNPVDPKGWFRVGKNTKKPIGYLKAKDALEWKNALLLSYVHPGSGPDRRKPVLMFEDRNRLEDLLLEDEPIKAAEKVYSDLVEGKVYDGIITREPDSFVDIRSKFYLLPVIDVKKVEGVDEDDESYLLQLAAAVPDKRTNAKDVCTTQRKDFRKCSEEMSVAKKGDLKVNIVYVIDLTFSMNPYVEAILEATRDSTRVLSTVDGAESRIKFGLIGYRDSKEADKNNEWPMYNFTKVKSPDGLVPKSEFINIIENDVKVKAGGDIPEDVYAGVLEGIRGIKWEEDAVKMLVLVGDASAHEPSHDNSSTKKSALELRQMASDEGIFITSIFIKNTRNKDDWPLAEQQFKKLAKNSSVETFWGVEAVKETIQEALFEATATIVEQIRDFKADRLKSATKNMALKAFNAGLVEYLGKASDPPPDITAWVYYHDLTNPKKTSFNIHVLVTRSDLDQLKAGLQEVLTSYVAGVETSEGFFKTIQALGTISAIDGKLEKATLFSKTTIIPRWMETLPFKTKMMDLSFEEFEEMDPDKLDDLQNELQSKMRAYSDILEKASAWQSLNDDLGADQSVYPLPIDLLP